MTRRQMPPVLVVDDSDGICSALRLLLDEEGYEVLWTGDGAAALRACFAVLPGGIVR